MKVLEALEALKARGPIDEYIGICAAAHDYIGTEDYEAIDLWNKHRTQCMRDWVEFSGNSMYPIPGYHGKTPGTAFNVTSDQNMWNPKHVYGASRLRLLDHCIEWFKNLEQ